jgi:hypothetical protein
MITNWAQLSNHSIYLPEMQICGIICVQPNESANETPFKRVPLKVTRSRFAGSFDWLGYPFGLTQPALKLPNPVLIISKIKQ